MALSYSLSHSAPPPRPLRIAGTDTFENWFSATLSNLVIIYTNSFCRNRGILNRHRCHYEANEAAWALCESCPTRTAPCWGFARDTSSSCTVKWKISFFTAPFPPHFFAFSLLSPVSEAIQSVMEARTKESEAGICLQASGRSSRGHRELYGAGGCWHERMLRPNLRQAL